MKTMISLNEITCCVFQNNHCHIADKLPVRYLIDCNSSNSLYILHNKL